MGSEKQLSGRVITGRKAAQWGIHAEETHTYWRCDVRGRR